MKFEKINSDKFAAFKGSEISNLQQIVGGYRGETGTNNASVNGCSTGGTDSDQVDNTGVVTGCTADNSGNGRNDGFGN